MKDSLLDNKSKSEILKAVKIKDYLTVIKILEKHKTGHACTAKMKDKRFVIKEIISRILQNPETSAREFYETGKYFINRHEDNSKELGVSLIWRGYIFDRKNIVKLMLKIADDKNWEVREYAAGAFAEIIQHHEDFFKTAMKLLKHKSENVRRAVLFSALGLVKRNDLEKAFLLLDPLLKDNSAYVKKNLGPFILGSYILRKFTAETMSKLKQWSKADNVNVKWNVIMSFKNAFGMNNPYLAFQILKRFKMENDPRLKRAIKSVLNFLSKKHKRDVSRFKFENGFD
ncbi:MAG: hypothetical protein HGGPFJEG_00880 [Ignavibacteria bacterium]|nr:hypothetical protein [Ignavibacteria bacterium]